MLSEKIEDYEILEHLGKGGFAHVYRAKCRRTNLFVAIKMIDKALMASAGMIGRVRQEVIIHSRLKHPAILELYTFFEDAHYVYLVLELAHNGELAKHFKLGTQSLSEKAASDIFRQVLSGVLYLHAHNIIHRDLSLNNLLLTKDLNVKIADFGLATQLNGPDEKHVTMCGTPNYISPEVASREVHGLPADVWGLGCMLYTLLVGSPPFHTQHIKTTLNKVINADYKIPPELSIQAQDLLQKLLCRDPIKRITLKGIMEHPFLNNMNGNTNKQDLSRDSGFLTTVHSTQHSGKLRGEEKFNLDYVNKSQDYDLGTKRQHLVPFNIFTGMTESSCNLNDPICNTKPSNFIESRSNEVNPEKCPNNISLAKYDSACNSGTEYLENIKSLNINKKIDFIQRDITNNKENTPATFTALTNNLKVSPLCADRLPTISHRTRNAILKIDPTGVIVEFIKKKGKDREEKVVEICKISKDGMKIIIYSTEKNKEKDLNKEYNPKPDEVFTYHNLPQKHWKKYLYASRFVDLVKAKTPKITLYSSLAKCQLMESGTDIDLFFYSGEKVMFTSTDGLKIIDKNLKTHYNVSNSPELKYIIDHFEDCSNRMKRIQIALSCIPDECYPLIVGKRPIQTTHVPVSHQRDSANTDLNTPIFNIGSFQHMRSTSSQVQSDYFS